MRKRRSWLIGFGLGIAIGAAVLQLMTAAQKIGGAADAAGGTLGREQLERQADALGLTIVDPNAPDGKTYTQAQLDAAVAEAKQEAAAEAASAANDKAEADKQPVRQAEKPAAPEKGEDAAAEPAGQAEQTRTFYVWVNASLEEVANGLQSLGLIEDKNAFLQYAKPYSKKIRVGPCTFTGKPTYDEIIAELTRGKN